MAVPLAVHDRTLGVLSLGAGRSGRRFGPATPPSPSSSPAAPRWRSPTRSSSAACPPPRSGSTASSARSPRRSPCTTPTGRILYANQAAADLIGVAGVGDLLAAEPGELVARFATTDEDGEPIPGDALPGYRVIRGEAPPPLLSRTVRRDTGESAGC